jgi:hypothetical protein
VAIVKNNQLNKEVSKVTKMNLSDIKFVMDRYFYYSIEAMKNGYPLTGCNELGIRLASILYSDIPKRLRRIFHYSSKIFGFVFLPICDHHELINAGYNYKPCKNLLEQVAETAETDAIYTLTKR